MQEKKQEDESGNNAAGFPAGLPPQAHVVRARTVDGYTASNGARRVKGQLWWFSAPRCFIVMADVAATVAPNINASGTPSTASSGDADELTVTTLSLVENVGVDDKSGGDGFSIQCGIIPPRSALYSSSASVRGRFIVCCFSIWIVDTIKQRCGLLQS